MTETYPNLTWALALNPKLKEMLFEEYNGNRSYLSQLEELILELKSLRCKCIQEEIKDVSNLYKFDSIISELETAKILAKNENRVVLLPDDYFQCQSPDILCQNDIINSYIEVTRLSGNDYLFNSIILPLTDFLKDNHYRIDVKLKENLSIPKVSGSERGKQEHLVELSLKEFEDKFKTNSLSEFPIVIDTTDIIFKIHKTISGNGYLGIFTSEVITVPSQTLREYVKERLIKKAIKRNDFEDIHRTYPYILAFDCHEWSIDTDEINQLLYGIITVIASPTNNLGEKEWSEIIKDRERNIPKWNEINAAKENGWSDLLIEKRLIPNNYAYLSEEGIFLSEQFMKNVSGVLFRKNNNISFYPNPFCSAEINYPDLQQRLKLF